MYIDLTGAGFRDSFGLRPDIVAQVEDWYRRVMIPYALDVWAVNSGNRYGSYTISNNPSSGIVIRVVPYRGIEGNGDIQGVTDSEVSGKYKTRATIRIQRRFSEFTPEARNTFLPIAAHILAHELGHAFGINGHSPNREDLMAGDGANIWDPASPRSAWTSIRDLNTMAAAYCQ